MDKNAKRAGQVAWITVHCWNATGRLHQRAGVHTGLESFLRIDVTAW